MLSKCCIIFVVCIMYYPITFSAFAHCSNPYCLFTFIHLFTYNFMFKCWLRWLIFYSLINLNVIRTKVHSMPGTTVDHFIYFGGNHCNKQTLNIVYSSLSIILHFSWSANGNDAISLKEKLLTTLWNKIYHIILDSSLLVLLWYKNVYDYS